MNPLTLYSYANQRVNVPKQKTSYRKTSVHFLGSIIAIPFRRAQPILNLMKSCVSSRPQGVHEEAINLNRRTIQSLPNPIIDSIRSYTDTDFQSVSKTIYQATRGTKRDILLGIQIGAILMSATKGALSDKQKQFILDKQAKVTALVLHLENQQAVDFLSENLLQAAARTFNAVKEIRISGKNVSDTCIIRIIKKFPGLTTLSVSGSHVLTDHSIQYITEHLGQLSHLQLSGCTNLTNQALTYIHDSVPTVQKLDISKCSKINRDGVRILRNHAQLRYLKVSHFMTIKETLASLKRRNPHLEVEEETIGKVMNCVNFVSDNVRKNKREILYVIAGIALCLLLREMDIAREAKRALDAEQKAAALRECETTFQKFPEARGYRCAHYDSTANDMHSLSKTACITKYERGQWFYQFLPLCSSFAQSTPNDTEVQRQFLEKKIEQEIALQKEYQLDEVKKSIQQLKGLVGDTVQNILQSALQDGAAVPAAAEKMAQDHCMKMMQQRHYAVAVQTICHGTNPTERAAQVQNLQESDLWPNSI